MTITRNILTLVLGMRYESDFIVSYHHCFAYLSSNLARSAVLRRWFITLITAVCHLSPCVSVCHTFWTRILCHIQIGLGRFLCYEIFQHTLSLVFARWYSFHCKHFVWTFMSFLKRDWVYSGAGRDCHGEEWKLLLGIFRSTWSPSSDIWISILNWILSFIHWIIYHVSHWKSFRNLDKAVLEFLNLLHLHWGFSFI